MKLAVIGSRTFTDRARLHSVLSAVKSPIDCLVSGGAKGADKMAEEWAEERGIPTEIYLPDYKAFDKRAPLVRNEKIIGVADGVIAFWDGASRGTKYALDFAERHRKPVKIIRFEVAPTTPPPVSPTCRVSILNEAPDGLPEWPGIIELIERLPAAEWQVQAKDGRVVVELGGTGPTLCFEVASYNEFTGLIELRLTDCIPPTSQYEFWFMPVEERDVSARYARHCK